MKHKAWMIALVVMFVAGALPA
ncbi:hypothetical protein LCGC14_2810430, partial [marine sediment metagenome]